MELTSPPIGLGIFARAPIPGHTKTRLEPALGPDGAARLHRAFLRDLLERFSATPQFAVTVWAAGAEADRAQLRDMVAPYSVEVRPQPEGDLGARMRVALVHHLEAANEAVLIGSDSPTLPAHLVQAAAHALRQGADVVLGPAADGGYYLIGARGQIPAGAFSGMPWSTPRVYSETVARLRGIRVASLPPWYDVDTPDDLRVLEAHLLVTPDAAPRTARELLSAGFDRPRAAR